MNILEAAGQGIAVAVLAEVINLETEVYPGITPQMNGDRLAFVLEFPGDYIDEEAAQEGAPSEFILKKIEEWGYRVVGFLADSQEGHEYYTIEKAG